MPPLNPDRNHFSVAPVGNVIIIGRHTALKGGLSRESALNLLGWLVIATGASPQEIKLQIALAQTPTGATPPVIRAVPPMPTAPQTVQAAELETFVGQVDDEEKAALDSAGVQIAPSPALVVAAALNSAGVQITPPPALVVAAMPKQDVGTSVPVDVEGISKEWNGNG